MNRNSLIQQEGHVISNCLSLCNSLSEDVWATRRWFESKEWAEKAKAGNERGGQMNSTEAEYCIQSEKARWAAEVGTVIKEDVVMTLLRAWISFIHKLLIFILSCDGLHFYVQCLLRKCLFRNGRLLGLRYCCLQLSRELHPNNFTLQ